MFGIVIRAVEVSIYRLLSEGDTASFYPDFIVWKEDLIYCLDTKGGHLLTDGSS